MSDEAEAQRHERQVKLSKAMGAMYLQDKMDKLERSVEPSSSSSSRIMRKTQSGSVAGPSTSAEVHMRSMPRAATGPGMVPVTSHSQAQARVRVRVVDASILILALRTVHNWARDMTTCVLVPLEAINTLDLLKKGEEPINLAARKATRWLEERMQAAPSNSVLLHPRPGIYAQGVEQTATLSQLEQRRSHRYSAADDHADPFAPRHAALHLRELLSICVCCQEMVGSDCDFAVSVAHAPVHLQAKMLETSLPASLAYAPRIDGQTTQAWLDAFGLPAEIAQTSKTWTGQRPSPVYPAPQHMSAFGSMSVLKAHHKSSPHPSLIPAGPDEKPMVVTSKPKASVQDTVPSVRAKTAAEKMEDFLKRLEA